MAFRNVDDVYTWPDGTWCYHDELEEMSHMSDDYTVIACGTDEWYRFLDNVNSIEVEDEFDRQMSLEDLYDEGKANEWY